MRVVRGFLLSLGLAALAIAAAAAFVFLRLPPDPRGAARVIEIPPGAALPEIALQLRQAGLLRSARGFALLARLKRVERRLQCGEYELSPAELPQRILLLLVEGKVLRHRFTVPEGYNLRQIAQALGQAGLAVEGRFLAAARDPAWVRSLGLPGDTLEGFLYPETYFLPRHLEERQIQRRMVENFQRSVTGEIAAEARALGLDLLSLVTLASIIEKEAGRAEERPLVSAVFHNRLRKGMRLQADPTVIYGLEEFDGNLTREDLMTSTPYNTYTRRGLPKGPICNPGLPSLQAALRPAPVPYLYFVARGDGTHVFSETLIDHNRRVDYFQKGQGRAKGRPSAPRKPGRPPRKGKG